MREQANAALEKLTQGVLRFQREVYPDRRREYEQAASQPQRPHTLLITCADSRIEPEVITSSMPGEIFVARNVGNIVPPYGEKLGGVTAVVEYAVDVLRVQQIVVCGHTDCGAMKALVQTPENLDDVPAVKSWLEHAWAARRATSRAKEKALSLEELTAKNVLLQLMHLRTHPSVAGAMAMGELSLSGWVYDIGRGDVKIFDESRGSFQNLRDGRTQMEEVLA